MSAPEKLAETVALLDEGERQRVLDFAEFLLAKRAHEKADWAVFEKNTGTWSGKFNREDCYDRKVLR
jgi:hypothetical protein